jgi:DNA mismatch repair protein MSH4
MCLHELMVDSAITNEGARSPPLSRSLPGRVLNRTKTKSGARLLRASLLQPLRDISTLTMRYDAVDELAQEHDLAFNVSTCLATLPKDLDKCVFNRITGH